MKLTDQPLGFACHLREMIAHYVRPTIQGVATGGVKKFVGSRQAEMTMAIKKSYLRSCGVSVTTTCHATELRPHTDTNSLRKTWPSGAAGLAYRAKIPAGPTLEKFSVSYRFAALSAASASCKRVSNIFLRNASAQELRPRSLRGQSCRP
jgi:hypothetical protein